jgi:hypothetical protein
MISGVILSPQLLFGFWVSTVCISRKKTTVFGREVSELHAGKAQEC